MRSIGSITQLLLVFVTSQALSQGFFEGEIRYNNTIESRSAVPTEKLIKLIGSEQHYFIKGGMYLSVTNGQVLPVQLYKNTTNRIYTKVNSSDTVYCIDASIEKSKIIESKMEDSTTVILGYTCKILTLKTSNNAIYRYYFSDKLKVQPEQFKNHNYSHWYTYLTKSQSIPIKTVMENSQFKMVSEAISIEAKQIPDKKFELPANAVIKCK